MPSPPEPLSPPGLYLAARASNPPVVTVEISSLRCGNQELDEFLT